MLIRLRPLIALVALVVCGGCVSARRGVAVALNADEVRVITALLGQEARHSRPILVLTPTASWIPPDRELDVSDLPAEVKQQLLAETATTNRVLAKLRAANRAPAALSGVVLPAGARLFPADDYERASRSRASFDAFVASVGGVEPLVLRVSRPVVDGDRSFVLLHVDSTWSGDGGANLFSIGAEGVRLEQVLAFW